MLVNTPFLQWGSLTLGRTKLKQANKATGLGNAVQVVWRRNHLVRGSPLVLLLKGNLVASPDSKGAVVTRGKGLVLLGQCTRPHTCAVLLRGLRNTLAPSMFPLGAEEGHSLEGLHPKGEWGFAVDVYDAEHCLNGE